MSGLFDGIGSALGGIAGSVVSFLGNKSLVEKQNEENRKLWYEQQEYNSPVNQMKRMKEAGLNPALIYSSGSSTASGNITSAPKMERSEMPDMPGILNYMQLSNLDAQNSNIKAQNENLIQDAVTKKMENWHRAREIDLLKKSDKKGFKMTREDPKSFRFLMRSVNQSAISGKKNSILSIADDLAGKVLRKMDDNRKRKLKLKRGGVSGSW